MIVWLLHNWKGYVRLRLHGYSPERFLNLCNARGLEVWGLICNRDGDYEFFMTVEGYRRVKPLVRKAQVRLHITGRFGLPFFIYRHRKRWYYGAGIMAFFMVLYVMSLFIWDIQFEGNYRYTYDTLVRFLDTQDIDYGMLKARINCEDLEASMRTSFPEITWVSARVSGTRLLIHIKENEVLSTIPEKDETPCDIVASQPGVITSMVVRQGVAQVCVGDEVEEGQVLVSGRVPIIGDNEEEINAYMVHADADIVARTVKQYEKTFPLLHQERVHTGRRRRGWYMKAGAWSFTFLTPVRGQGEWDYSMEEKQLRLFSNFYLPVYIGAIQGREMVSYESNYTKEELEHISKAINYQFVKNLEEKGVQILENNDRIETSVSECRLTGELVTEESIVKTQPAAEPDMNSGGEPGEKPEETITAE